uniref:Uncharacterized protein n=1 Tax=Meloidogyne enterolobii TaxID=390850 RepID=A0A6V7W7Q0_MELEN|nr:unnamed protein product [Meloidogyne enterolobii]
MVYPRQKMIKILIKVLGQMKFVQNETRMMILLYMMMRKLKNLIFLLLILLI